MTNIKPELIERASRLTDWIAKRREVAVGDALWRHVDGGIIVEEIPGDPCTCSSHYGAHEAHCGIEYVTTLSVSEVAAPIVDARNSLPLALKALEAVLELHYLVAGQADCGDQCYGSTEDECGACQYPWPCPSVVMIREALHVSD